MPNRSPDNHSRRRLPGGSGGSRSGGSRTALRRALAVNDVPCARPSERAPSACIPPRASDPRSGGPRIRQPPPAGWAQPTAAPPSPRPAGVSAAQAYCWLPRTMLGVNDHNRGASTVTLVGKTVGRFRVQSLLGRGGMGEVYVAHDETLDRNVALKSIVARQRLEPAAKARFVREARALSRLDHPNICRIYDYVELGARDFLVLELVSGRNLDAAIREGLARDVQLKVAQQIADALVAAHGEGIVHRDLKPSNVMLADNGDVKVLDFGLAFRTERRDAPAPPPPAIVAMAEPELPQTEHGFAARPAPAVVAEDEPEITLLSLPAPAIQEPAVVAVDTGTAAHAESVTQHGIILGPPGYLSPEQARAEAATTASDMYAFGLLLQSLFTGQPPHPKGLEKR